VSARPLGRTWASSRTHRPGNRSGAVRRPLTSLPLGGNWGWAKSGASALFEHVDRIEPPPIRTRPQTRALRVIHSALSDSYLSGWEHLSIRAWSAHGESEHGCCADRRPATCAVRHSAEFSSPRRRMDSAPSPNRPERTENYRRPRTKGMGCEVEGRACSRGRAVVNTPRLMVRPVVQTRVWCDHGWANCPAPGGAFFCLGVVRKVT
jgi:hypothetical protein